MSHAAVFITCQIPDKSGLPSAVRGIDDPGWAARCRASAADKEIRNDVTARTRTGESRGRTDPPQLKQHWREREHEDKFGDRSCQGHGASGRPVRYATRPH